MRRAFLLLTTVLVIGLAGAAGARSRTATQAPRPSVPAGFVGMNANGPLVDPADHVNLAHQLDLMVASGVDTIRVGIYWSAEQPYPKGSTPPAGSGGFVDVNGVPTNFSATDQIVALAAARRMTVLPVVLGAPAWDARHNRHGIDVPARVRPYTDYLTALVRRYGHGGTFWRGRATAMPITRWQIWNEPNLELYWPAPWEHSYAALLRASYSAVKAADHRAQVVAGALTNYAWTGLGQLTRALHGHRAFDIIAVNGFTRTADSAYRFVHDVRSAADHLGLGKVPMLATELGWTSARGHGCSQVSTWDTTTRGQATQDAGLVHLLSLHAHSLGLVGFDLVTWMGDESSCSSDFNFAGLLRYRAGRLTVKPALGAFRRAALSVEGCGRKTRADRCSR